MTSDIFKLKRCNGHDSNGKVSLMKIPMHFRVLALVFIALPSTSYADIVSCWNGCQAVYNASVQQCFNTYLKDHTTNQYSYYKPMYDVCVQTAWTRYNDCSGVCTIHN